MDICYKIVRKNSLGKLFSCVDGQFALEYKVGEIIKPKIGKIFVFKDLPKGWQVSQIISPVWCKVFKCVASELVKADCYCGSLMDFDIEYFWEYFADWGKFGNYPPPIRGTYFCSEIVLLKEVKIKH